MRKKLVLLGILFVCGSMRAQTCCSGGVPISGNVGMPSVPAGDLQFNLSYDLNVLNTLKEGGLTIEDEARTRRTHSLLMQSSYSITKSFAIDLLFTWVRQERIIRQFGNIDRTSTDGAGDAVLLVKYKIFKSKEEKRSITGGVGIKFPVGPSDLKRDDGLPINADLQPGSGAWDLLFWGQFFQSSFLRPTMDLSFSSIYSIKGKNTQYLGEQTYQFGREFQLISSVADRLLLGDLILDPAISLRYRKSWSDLFNNVDLPSTGGDWIFVSPGLTFWPKDKFAIQTRLDLPIYSKVIGNQLTVTYRFQLGLYFKIESKKVADNFDFPI